MVTSLLSEGAGFHDSEEEEEEEGQSRRMKMRDPDPTWVGAEGGGDLCSPQAYKLSGRGVTKGVPLESKRGTSCVRVFLGFSSSRCFLIGLFLAFAVLLLQEVVGRAGLDITPLPPTHPPKGREAKNTGQDLIMIMKLQQNQLQERFWKAAHKVWKEIGAFQLVAPLPTLVFSVTIRW